MNILTTKLKINRANSKSLRTTVPSAISQLLDLDEYSELEWHLQPVNNEIKVYVKKRVE